MSHLIRLFATVRHLFNCHHLICAHIPCLANTKYIVSTHFNHNIQDHLVLGTFSLTKDVVFQDLLYYFTTTHSALKTKDQIIKLSAVPAIKHPGHGLVKITLYKLFLFFIEDQIATLFITVRQILAHCKLTDVLNQNITCM